jgi:hypothetical protein
LVGGDVNVLSEYLNSFWEVCEKVLEKGFLCTEEAIMKVVHDLNTKIILNFYFSSYQTSDHDRFHFETWNDGTGDLKPLYMVWHDILNY